MRRASTTRPGLLLAVALLLALRPGPAGAAWSLRFSGNGTGDIDRVKIRIDGPVRPADVGAGDFTLEWWIKAFSGDNASSTVTCGANGGWVAGNVVFDRDVNGAGDFGEFGVSLTAGRVAFGLSIEGAGTTICGGRIVADGQWHHVAVTRRAADGRLRLHVDGMLDADGAGPTGNASYRDGRMTGDPDTDPFLVIGAQKRNAGPAYRGWIDEVRLSSVVRYASQFTRPAAPFAPDAQTVALYHLDEGTGITAADTSGAAGGPSHGELRVGGTPAGPVWSADVAPLDGAATVGLEPVVTGLTSPLGIVHAGDPRLFVVQRAGQIVIVDGTQVRSPAFLDIAGLIACCAGERGLLGLAFHPEYATNRFFFVSYTELDGLDRHRALPALGDEPRPGERHLGPGAAPDGARPVRQPQRRPARVRARRVPLRVDRRRRRRGRPPEHRAEPRHASRQDPPDRRGQCRSVCDPRQQSLRRHGRRAGRDLGVRRAEPVAVRLRPADGRPLHRRRRTGGARGDRLPAGDQPRRRELRLVVHGGLGGLRHGAVWRRPARPSHPRVPARGTAITWTATVTGGGSSYQYRFWRRTTGPYTIVQDYGPSASFTWTPGPGDVGEHQVAVWVRNVGSSAAVEAGLIAAPFTITAGGAPIQVTALTANRTPPQPVGTPIIWTVTVSGGSGRYEYRFWRRTAGPYMIVQDYGASATYTFTPSPADVGIHEVAVWVRNAASAATVEAGFIAAPFTIGP